MWDSCKVRYEGKSLGVAEWEHTPFYTGQDAWSKSLLDLTGSEKLRDLYGQQTAGVIG